MIENALGPTIVALWIAWLVVWFASARTVKETSWRESGASQLRHRVPLTLAVYLLIATAPPPAFMTVRFLPRIVAIEILGAALVLGGLAFAVWARWYLGTNWSAMVTVKKNHSLIRGGPYALVRHPIYTGVLVAFLGTAVALGQVRGLVGLGLATVAFVLKSRVEEARMSSVFPEYAQYRRETAAIIPFVV
jgi:protein-S-isoprenylcysteine O-methyltransferase Ste14